MNASPKAAEFSVAHRDAVIALARRTNRFVAGVNDSHGWGATSLAWNLIAAPGWRNARDPCTLILDRLRTGFASNQIVERHHLRAESAWPRWLTPIGAVVGDVEEHGHAIALELACLDVGGLGDPASQTVTILSPEYA